MPRQGYVTKYKFPELDIKKRGEEESSFLIFLKIGVPLIAGIILITIIVGIIVYKVRQYKLKRTAQHIPVNEYDLPTYNDVMKE
jgi:hypothetical protein